MQAWTRLLQYLISNAFINKAHVVFLNTALDDFFQFDPVFPAKKTFYVYGSRHHNLSCSTRKPRSPNRQAKSFLIFPLVSRQKPLSSATKQKKLHRTFDVLQKVSQSHLLQEKRLNYFIRMHQIQILPPWDIAIGTPVSVRFSISNSGFNNIWYGVKWNQKQHLISSFLRTETLERLLTGP